MHALSIGMHRPVFCIHSFFLAVGLKLNNFRASSLKGKLLSNLGKQRVVQWRAALNPKCEGEIFEQDLNGIIGRLAGSIFRG